MTDELRRAVREMLYDLGFRHLPGKHDQSSHGRKKKVDISLGDVPDEVKKQVFSSYKTQPKGQLISSLHSDSYDNLVAVAHVYGKKVPGGSLSVGLAAQIVDEQLAKAQKLQNANLLENKIKGWLKTADGAAYAKVNTKPKKSIVDSLTGNITPPKGVELKPGEKVQKVGGPGKFDPKLTAADFKNLTAKQMQDSQDKYMQQAGIVWTPEQLAGLKSYTGGGYTPMNDYLRGTKKAGSIGALPPAVVKQNVLQTQSAMIPLQSNALLLRGTGWEQFPAAYRSPQDVKKLVGKTIEDKGFVSTSASGSGGQFGGMVNLEIEAPAGTPGVFVKSVSVHKGENEFLLAAGTKFRVVSVKASPNGMKATVRLRVVTPK